MTFADLAPKSNRWEVDGLTLVPLRWEARLTRDERRAALDVVAFQSVMDTLSCAMCAPRPRRVEA